MFNMFAPLKRPTQLCYVIKRPVTQTMFSIDRAGRKTVVAFRGKDKARTMKRLIAENNEKDRKVAVEQVEIAFLTKTCALNGLDFMLYNEDHTYMIHTALDDVCDDVIFALENTYKYGADADYTK